VPKPLVIVESPAKAKTISRFLGGDFVVESSIGHVRDLPVDAADIPAAYKGESWSRLGVDVENDFKPLYVVSREKKQQVTKLKQLLKEASELYLATDEDREGEAIAWHLLELLQPKVPVKRMVFHEITRQAIEHAVDNWRDLNRHLVDAQEGRRILDRLVGYEVSPILWRKVRQGLSAGRVQSVATRILVERERERIKFRPAEYWDLEAIFDKVNGDAVQPFNATLVSLDGKRLATGKDFNDSGELTKPDAVVLNGEGAQALVDQLRDAPFEVTSVEEKPYRRSPYAPFMTSTLQQEAGRKLRFSSRRAMQAAQRLYEQGYITYMRTDSTTLSEQALNAARDQARSLYGPDYVPDAPRRYEKKVKNAQEAHEAIRPAGEQFRKPDDVAREVGATTDEAKLYDLVWKRTVASQMADARGQSVQARIVGLSSRDERAEFAASGKTITFPGFLRAYVEGSDDPDAALEDREVHLPEMAVGHSVSAAAIDAEGNSGIAAKSHATQPPARYTEASLVKTLEELGVGRPSTYASIINTIQQRGYCWKKGSALVPSFVAFSVVRLLEERFSHLVDYGFTASMENELDEIAGGREETVPWLKKFYFGTGGNSGNGDKPGLKQLVSDDTILEIDPRELNTIPLGDDHNGEPIIIRVRWGGAVVQRGDEMAAVPEGLAPDEITVEKAEELFESSKERNLGVEPETGLTVWVKSGRFGPYVQLGELNTEDKKAEKPRTASLLKTMRPELITYEEAMSLLSLPRLVGTDPESGDEIMALNGRFGPYLTKGSDSRSLEAEEQLFTVTLEEALALFAQPKRRRGQSAAGPLRELGDDPTTGKKIVIKDGRFGPYATDGETNASIPRAESVEEITFERAAELLAERRAAGPKKGRKTAAKKPAAKKPAAKKTTTAKKAGTKTAAAKTAAAKKTATKTTKTSATKTKKSTTAKKAVTENAPSADGED
jgi:DNA topoisomerase-1